MCNKLGDFILLYGSQTGQAKAIAENIAERTEKHGLTPRLHCLSGTEKQFSIEKERVAVIVLSTTGDGDYPDTASKFCRRLHKKDLPRDHLKDLSFALLGLGDTNYNNFCASPKKVEKRLLELGAKKFYETAFCDDAVGTELTAEPWMEELVPALKKHLGMKSGGETATLTNGFDSKDRAIEIPSPVKPNRPSVDQLAVEFVSKCALDKDQSVDLHGLGGSCGCVWPTPSLICSSSMNTVTDLKVPVTTAPFLAIEFLEADGEACGKESATDSNLLQYPSQGSSVFSATLISRRQLTKAGAKKDKFEITLEFEAPDVGYEPGDAFYFIIPNVAKEVEWLLKRLKLENVADKKCKLRILADTTRKNAKVPAYLDGVHSLRHIFTNLVDIRRFLSKSTLRYLADCCDKMEEKRRLLELVSTQGAAEYDEFVRNANLSVLDILHAFPSCAPSVERLLEYLPQLQPRPYSAASYGNGLRGGKRRVRCAYSLVSIMAENGRFYHRDGLATARLTACSIGHQVKLFMKKPGKFRLLPEHGQCSVIMVGPGTGVAPFIGFLERIRIEKQASPSAFPDVRLFFGCRNEKLDFLYREELEQVQAAGILSHLYVAFSRDDESAPHRYVQDQIRQHGEELSRVIIDQLVRIYVCGDAKHMAVDVFAAFCDILSKHGGKSDADAVAFLRKMQGDDRYVQDVWT